MKLVVYEKFKMKLTFESAFLIYKINFSFENCFLYKV
nr:MAG TPA: hypothetical protein [Bacteriophage sp.]